MISNHGVLIFFDHQVIAEIKKDLHGKTLLQAGGWTDKNDRQVRTEQKKIDFSRSTFLNFERPSTSTSKQQFFPEALFIDLQVQIDQDQVHLRTSSFVPDVQAITREILSPPLLPKASLSH